MSTLSERLRTGVDDPGIFDEAADELDRLTAELAKAKAMPMKYRRMEFNAQLQEENSRLTARVAELEKAFLLADRMCTEALPKFNWGASALDANAIRLLNDAPLSIKRALEHKHD